MTCMTFCEVPNPLEIKISNAQGALVNQKQKKRSHEKHLQYKQKNRSKIEL